MGTITLSVPEWLYRLMKRYGRVDWSEVARRAIAREALKMKALEEGLTREEVELLTEIMGLPRLPAEGEGLLEQVEERERRRLEKIRGAEG